MLTNTLLMLRTENGITQDYQTKHIIAIKQKSWNKNNTIALESNNFDQKVKEALEFQYHNTKQIVINIDDGQYATTKFWMLMFSFLKNEKKKRKHQTKTL